MAQRHLLGTLVPVSVGALLATLAFSGCSGDDAACLDDTGQPLSTACAKSSTLVKGVDVSKWQASIDWNQVKSQGYEFAFIRASDGLNYPDGQFKANWQGAKAAGVIRGVYQFFRPSQDPIAQADLMLAKLQDAGWLEGGDLPCVIDIEVAEGQSNTTIRNKSLSWLQYVEQKTGKKPIVYTAAGWSSVLGNALSAYPLWIANYTGDPSNSCPLMPDGWQTWLFWQYTSKGPVAGVGSKDVDKNVWDGTLAQLESYAATGTVPPPPANDGGSGGDPCANASSGNGAYCGITISGDPATLYNCQSNVTASKQVCANGCTVMPPGTADQCASGSTDPCAKATSGNGHYCGKTLGGDPNTLYNCSSGKTLDTQLCEHGCLLNPPGTADVCEKAPAPPSGGGGTTGAGGTTSGGGATSGGGGEPAGGGGWGAGSSIDGSVGTGGAAGDQAMGNGGC